MTTMDTNFRYVSVTEAAAILGVTTGRVRQLLASGQIRGHKLGAKQWAIDPAEVAQRKLRTHQRKKSG